MAENSKRLSYEPVNSLQQRIKDRKGQRTTLLGCMEVRGGSYLGKTRDRPEGTYPCQKFVFQRLLINSPLGHPYLFIQ